MCGFYCITFIEHILAGNTLLHYTNLFSPNDYKKNDVSILKINMTEEISLEFRFRKIDETRNYLLEEIKNNDLMSENCKKTRKYLNYVEHLLNLVSTVTGCVLISAFASLVCVPVCIKSSAVGIKIRAIIAEIKKYKAILKKKKKKHDKLVLLRKDKLILLKF